MTGVQTCALRSRDLRGVKRAQRAAQLDFIPERVGREHHRELRRIRGRKKQREVLSGQPLRRVGDELGDPSELHRLKNQLSIIYGFADLILVEMPAGDPHAPQMAEIQRTVMAALEILRDPHDEPEEQ